MLSPVQSLSIVTPTRDNMNISSPKIRVIQIPPPKEKLEISSKRISTTHIQFRQLAMTISLNKTG
jgi:hypothetical protein